MSKPHCCPEGCGPLVVDRTQEANLRRFKGNWGKRLQIFAHSFIHSFTFIPILGVEARASSMLGKHSTTALHPRPLKSFLV